MYCQVLNGQYFRYVFLKFELTLVINVKLRGEVYGGLQEYFILVNLRGNKINTAALSSTFHGCEFCG